MFHDRTIASITSIHPSFKDIADIRILSIRNSRFHNPLISFSIMIEIWSVLLKIKSIFLNNIILHHIMCVASGIGVIPINFTNFNCSWNLSWIWVINKTFSCYQFNVNFYLVAPPIVSCPCIVSGKGEEHQ